MSGWWTYSRCARWVKTYQDMPWYCKLLENLGIVLTPVLYGLAAYLQPDGWTRVAYWAFASTSFLGVIVVSVQHIRGRAALERGIVPAPLKAITSYGMEKWVVILWFLFLVTFVTALLLRPVHRLDPEGWSAFTWYAGMFMTQLSWFVRSRFIKVSQSGHLIEASQG